MTTIDKNELIRLANSYKLSSVNFVDKNGKMGARGKEVTHVQLLFSTRKWVQVLYTDFESLQDTITFTILNDKERDAIGLPLDSKDPPK